MLDNYVNHLTQGWNLGDREQHLQSVGTVVTVRWRDVRASGSVDKGTCTRPCDLLRLTSVLFHSLVGARHARITEYKRSGS
jgi:hypothetical protein